MVFQFARQGTHRVVLGCSLLAATLLLALPAPALALVDPMSLGELSKSADAVVFVQVAGSSVRADSAGRSGKHPFIYTDSRVHVLDAFKGVRSGDLTISVAGGRLAGITMVADDMPVLTQGEQTVLFLDKRNRIIGGYQGEVDVRDGASQRYALSVPALEASVRESAGLSPVLGPYAPVASATESAAPLPGDPLAPSISAISPSNQISGLNSQVTITGSGFGASAGSVTFVDGLTVDGTGRRAGTVVSWSDTQVVVRIPENCASGEVRVTTALGLTAGRTYDMGFSTDGRKWPSSAQPVAFRVNENCPDMSSEGAQVQAAMATWNAAGSRFRMTYAGASSVAAYPPPGDRVNEIHWSSAPEEGFLAINYRWYGGLTVYESDIVLNDNYTWAASATGSAWDVQTVVLHEMGHTVGLLDQYPNLTRVMGAGVWGQNKRVLTQDEIDGAIFLYGADVPPPAAPAVSSASHPNQSAWSTATTASFSFTATGATGFSYSLDTAPATDPDTVSEGAGTSAAFSSLATGDRYFHVRAVNAEGSWSTTTHYRVRVDVSAPAGTVQIGPAGSGTAYVATTTVAIAASLADANSGLSQMRADAGAGYGAWAPYAASSSVALAGADGTRTVSLQFRDALGNTRTDSRAVVLDRVAPTTSSDAAASYLGQATIHLTAADSLSGVSASYYSVDGGPAAQYGSAVVVASPGDHSVAFYSVDRAGNAEAPQYAAFTVQPLEPALVTRINGADRYAVSAAAAATAFPGFAGVTDVVIASGADRAAADPLAAASLAGAYYGPVLLVSATLSGGRLPTATENALAQIRAANGGRVNIHVVGGTGTVSSTVYTRLSALKGAGGTIDRISGKDRYQLSVNIAEKIVALVGIDEVPGVLLANGDRSSAFYDALAASPIAYSRHMPLLITPATSLNGDVAAALAGPLAGKPVTAVNASGNLATSVLNAAGATQRMATTTERTGAARDIADYAIARSWLSSQTVVVANKLPDALTGGSAIGRIGGVVLYTDASSLAAPTYVWLSDNRFTVRRAYVAGGTASVAPATMSQVSAALQ